jgi:uncharacterized coiled-coil DUF342 family protein
MGLGSATKKLQKATSLAEETYKRINELREQLQELRETVETTSDQVDQIEHDLAEQRALIEALAEKEDIDVETIVADANIEDVAPANGQAEDGKAVPVTEAETGSESSDTAGE